MFEYKTCALLLNRNLALISMVSKTMWTSSVYDVSNDYVPLGASTLCCCVALSILNVDPGLKNGQHF